MNHQFILSGIYRSTARWRSEYGDISVLKLLYPIQNDPAPDHAVEIWDMGTYAGYYVRMLGTHFWPDWIWCSTQEETKTQAIFMGYVFVDAKYTVML